MGSAGARTEDHPRVCGEKVHLAEALVALDGSPPRVRGEVAGQHVGAEHGGITPACAGRSL